MPQTDPVERKAYDHNRYEDKIKPQRQAKRQADREEEERRRLEQEKEEERLRLEQEEDATRKYQDFRKRNNAAAKKCREKKKMDQLVSGRATSSDCCDHFWFHLQVSSSPFELKI